VTIQSQPSHDDATKYQKPDHDLDTIGDLFAALRSCWSPPPADAARQGMQMSVLFRFKKSGAMIAPPRMTFVTQGAPADIQDAYLKSINASLRTIFRNYLRLGSLNRLLADLRDRGIVTKVRTLKTGKTVGGIPFTRGPLAHLLRNRFYIGEVSFKG
jgi:hypothetical protein